MEAAGVSLQLSRGRVRVVHIEDPDYFSDGEIVRTRTSRRLARSPRGVDTRRVSFEEPPQDDNTPLAQYSLSRRGTNPARPRQSSRSPHSRRPDASTDAVGNADPPDDTRIARHYGKQVPSPPPGLRRKAGDRYGEEGLVSALKPSPSPTSGSRRRVVSFSGAPLPRPHTPPAPRTVGLGLLSPQFPEDPLIYGVSPDRSPRLNYRRAEPPPSPLIVPTEPVSAVRRSAPSIPIIKMPADSRPEPITVSKRAWGKERPRQSSATSPDFPTATRSAGGLGDKTYRYRSLGHREFRLVEILPAKMATIKCNILHFSLENPPRYVAVSYAWGDAGDVRRIQVEGVTIPVSVSLFGALQALRQRVNPVLVWVDALCIDQSNSDERTAQVQLMPSIYTVAESVAVWLGPDADDSALAMELLHEVTDRAESHSDVRSLLASMVGKRDLAAVIALFERDYWRRVWVVQEVHNARAITVYCGSLKLPWAVFKLASHVFKRHRNDLDEFFPNWSNSGPRNTTSRHQFTYSQVLIYQGPASLPELPSHVGLGEDSLLDLLRVCRRKLAADPRDKVFSILGVLPDEIRSEFPPNYSLSVKEVYTDVVDFLMTTTERIDVICEAMHFPVMTSAQNLPSFVPDWSQIPQTASLGSSFSFRASGATKAQFKFLDERRNRLQLSAVYLDTIRSHGVAVGTLCTLADYLMAFVHWRALLLGSHDAGDDRYSAQVQEAFCETLCLGQIPTPWKKRKPRDWLDACYLVFSSLLHERLPHLPLDKELGRYVDAKVDAIKPEDRRRFLQDNFGSRWMSRCFCLTTAGRMGMGTGFMAPGDVVVVPLGCDTPIILRPEGAKGEYRFVGDVYIHGYMQGKVIEQWRHGKREIQRYVLR